MRSQSRWQPRVWGSVSAPTSSGWLHTLGIGPPPALGSPDDRVHGQRTAPPNRPPPGSLFSYHAPVAIGRPSPLHYRHHHNRLARDGSVMSDGPLAIGVPNAAGPVRVSEGIARGACVEGVAGVPARREARTRSGRCGGRCRRALSEQGKNDLDVYTSSKAASFAETMAKSRPFSRTYFTNIFTSSASNWTPDASMSRLTASSSESALR